MFHPLHRAMIQRSVALPFGAKVLMYTMDRGNTQPHVALDGAALPLTGFFWAE